MLLSTIVALFCLLLSGAGASALDPNINLSDNDGESTLPRIAIADNGQVYIVWQDDSPSLMYANSTDGENFDGPFELSSVSTSALNPRIGVSGSGIFYVVWQDNSPGNNDIFLASSADDFATITNISNNSGSSTGPQLAVVDEDVYVVWQDNSPGNLEIFFASSTDDFASNMNVSNSTTSSFEPSVGAASNGTAYVAWRDNNEIFFASSGDNFAGKINISNTADSSTTPQLAVAGDDTAYVAWIDDLDILLKSSADDFATPTNISNTPETSLSPQIALAGSDVYVAWRESDSGNNEIYFKSSADNFATPTNISDNDGDSSSPQLLTGAGTNVFVTWRDNYLDIVNNTNTEVLLSASSNGGADFSCPVNLSGTAGFSTSQHVAVVDDAGADSLYIVWQDDTTSAETSDIFLQAGVDIISSPIITIDAIDDALPLWNSTVEISGGVVSADVDDSITIDWGDGSTTEDEPISGCSWGPIPHFYNSSAVSTNPNQVVAKIVALDDTVKSQSAPLAVEVQPHPTSLTLDPIASVRAGDNVTVAGVLMDDELSAGIEGKAINFTGDGADGVFESVLTGAAGMFSSDGATQGIVQTGWLVDAHFAGDDLYLLSDSDSQTYNTVDSGAVEYNVSAGVNQVVDIFGEFSFNASITFSSVDQDGSFFAFECEADVDADYISPELACLEVSSAVEMTPGSSATVTISYEGDPPAGHTVDEVDMFYYDPSQDLTLDITESKDPGNKAVIGNTTSIEGKFIAAVANYNEKPPGAVRQQVFIGNNINNNIISLRDVNNMDNVTVQAQFDKESYEMSDTAVLNITDANGNIDPDVVNYVFADIQSNSSASSAPDILRLVLEETGTDTGVFSGSFTFSNFITSDEPPILKAAVGDQLFVFYTQGARFQAGVSNTTESSMLQMQDALPETPTHFTPIGGAVDLQLIGTDIFGDQTTINVTMSYANALLLGNDPSDLTIFQFREGVWTNMTDLTTVSVDIGAKTVSTGAVVAKQGVFTLAFDFPLPGGGGGGLPRPGTGIVLDSVISIAATINDDSGDNSDDESNGSGGGGRRVVVVSNNPTPEAQSISTFSDAHFDDRPLDRIEINQAEFLDANDNSISEASVGQEISITSTFSNHQQGPQKYSFIVLVIDEDGFAVDIMWQEGVVEGGQSAELSTSWTPQKIGAFTIKMFMWDGFDSPSPLSQVLTNNISAV